MAYVLFLESSDFAGLAAQDGIDLLQLSTLLLLLLRKSLLEIF